MGGLGAECQALHKSLSEHGNVVTLVPNRVRHYPMEHQANDLNPSTSLVVFSPRSSLSYILLEPSSLKPTSNVSRLSSSSGRCQKTLGHSSRVAYAEHINA